MSPRRQYSLSPSQLKTRSGEAEQETKAKETALGAAAYLRQPAFPPLRSCTYGQLSPDHLFFLPYVVPPPAVRLAPPRSEEPEPTPMPPQAQVVRVGDRTRSFVRPSLFLTTRSQDRQQKPEPKQVMRSRKRRTRKKNKTSIKSQID